ncbi:MAG: GNAT family N-acetyltransferase, partial [Alphaproteobacteria bacterium]|nr:GNAT family N-acetyltransferase [Alphaproteobacteria bacterium]
MQYAPPSPRAARGPRARYRKPLKKDAPAVHAVPAETPTPYRTSAGDRGDPGSAIPPVSGAGRNPTPRGMTSRSMTLAGDVVDPGRMDAATESGWRDLLLAQPNPVAFLGPTFSRAVARTKGLARVCILRSSGRAVGYFAFQYPTSMKRGLAAAERIGGEMADYAGLVAEPGLAVTPADLLRLAGLQVFTFSHLAQSQQDFGLTGEDPRVGLRIEFPEGPAEYWKQRRKLDASLVRDTERRRRKLEQDVGPIRFEFQAGDRAAALEHLVAAKRAQYARTGAEDALTQDWQQSLLRALSTTDQPDCTGVLSTLHAGDKWVAFHFGLRCADTLHYWFPVYNPELSKFSPGRLLLLETINASQS